MSATPTSEPQSLSQQQDDMTMAQEAQIRADIAAKDELVASMTLPFSVLEKEYASNPAFLRKIADLPKQYSSYRRVRGDGNCFYRAYVFAILEIIAVRRDAQLLARLQAHLGTTMERMVALDMPDYCVEPFHDMLVDEVTPIATSVNDASCDNQKDDMENATVTSLRAHFNDDETSMYIVMMARFLTSTYLQEHADDFIAFLPDGCESVKRFCTQQVEPINRESDNLQCTALVKEFGIPLRIEYLDQTDGGLVGHVIPDGDKPIVHLLYRPGHYDILYEK
jgi:ubiquitin thioesterase protein OTUB1